LNTAEWTEEEDALLGEKVVQFGANWNKIGKFFVNRPDIGLRNRWQMLARRAAATSQDARAAVKGDVETSPDAEIERLGAKRIPNPFDDMFNESDFQLFGQPDAPRRSNLNDCSARLIIAASDFSGPLGRSRSLTYRSTVNLPHSHKKPVWSKNDQVKLTEKSGGGSKPEGQFLSRHFTKLVFQNSPPWQSWFAVRMEEVAMRFLPGSPNFDRHRCRFQKVHP
jgi:hypothetical protein